MVSPLAHFIWYGEFPDKISTVNEAGVLLQFSFFPMILTVGFSKIFNCAIAESLHPSIFVAHTFNNFDSFAKTSILLDFSPVSH